MRNILCFAALTLLVVGCGSGPHNRLVVYQSADYVQLPMPSTMPLRGQPIRITAQSDVAAIFDAVNHPDGKAFSGFARNNRLALVGEDGRIVMYGITGNVDITRTESSTKLGPALAAALIRAQVVKLAPSSPILGLSYHDSGTDRPLPSTAIAKSKKPLLELLNCYSPLALKGNKHCGPSEVRDYAKRMPRFLTIKLAKRDSFGAIVATKEIQWPPDTYDTSSRLEQVTFDTITVFSESNGLTRFIFTDSKSNACLFTDPVNSLRLVKKAHGHNPRVYGPDLFNEVVSEMRKP